MSSKNVRAENTTIRPFRNIGAANVALESVVLLVDDEEEKPGPVVVAPETLASAKLTLTLPDIEYVREQVEKTGLHVPDCALVILATGRSHRGASRVVYCEHLNKADYSTSFVLHRTPDDLALSDRQGFTVTVAIVLLVDYATTPPLRPNMAGTWLARRDFRVAVERDQTSFSPEPLTEQVRKANNLPAGVMRYIDYHGSIESAEDIAEVVTVYVDPTVLTRLFATETKAASIKEQTELAVQSYAVIATAMLDEIRGELGAEPTETDLVKYPVAEHLFDYIANTLSEATSDDISVSKVLKFVKTPGLLASHLEVAFKMRDMTLTAL